jgi:hypothetical protein
MYQPTSPKATRARTTHGPYADQTAITQLQVSSRSGGQREGDIGTGGCDVIGSCAQTELPKGEMSKSGNGSKAHMDTIPTDFGNFLKFILWNDDFFISSGLDTLYPF